MNTYYSNVLSRLCALLLPVVVSVCPVTPAMAAPALAARALPASSEEFEKPHVLSAARILPAHLLKGPRWSVDDRVTSDGYFNNYRIRSDYGVMEIEGRQLLEIRISEMAALEELDKLSSSSVFQDAAYKAGKGIVMAPVKLVKKTTETVSDPKKMMDTLSAVPEGAEQLFSWAYRKTKGAAHAVGNAFSSSDNTKSRSSSSSGGESSVGDTLDQGAKLGLEYIGYSKNQRAWFKKLQVNPYTSNQLLRDEVVRVAGIETAVGTAFKFVPGLGLLGELSTINMWYSRAEKLSLYEDPDVIKQKNRAEMQKLNVPEELLSKFQDNKAYSPWSRRFISSSLSAIGPSVSGHAEFIRAACEAKNEPSTLYFVSVAEAFEKRHAKSRLKRIVASLHLPAAITSDKRLYVPLPVDYLFWNETVAGIFSGFKQRVAKEAGFSSIEIAIRGRVSPLARKRLEALGARVSEGSL